MDTSNLVTSYVVTLPSGSQIPVGVEPGASPARAGGIAALIEFFESAARVWVAEVKVGSEIRDLTVIRDLAVIEVPPEYGELIRRVAG